MEEIYNYIISSYQALWHVKDYGKTLEITTPVATTNDMFVTVFITKRGDDYVATDGAWIQSGLYECEQPKSVVYRKVFNYYLNKYGIQETSGSERVFYYKKINKLDLLPNIVFDVANFIGAVISSAGIQYISDRAERTFKKNAQGYLCHRFGNTFDYDKQISDSIQIKFSAISNNMEKKNIINFVSGSNSSYYANSLCRSNMNFGIIIPQKQKFKINNMITLLDDSNESIVNSQHVQAYYNYLLDNRSEQKPVVLWKQKSELNKYIA